VLKLSESQLRNLVREMQTAHYPGSGDDLRGFLRNEGLDGQLEMFLDIATDHGPIEAMAWAEGVRSLGGTKGHRWTYDEAITLINLLNSNGWFK